MSARYAGTNPAATNGFAMGVPLPELETDDTGVELNSKGLTVVGGGEGDTFKVPSSNCEELEADDSGIALQRGGPLFEHEMGVLVQTG